MNNSDNDLAAEIIKYGVIIKGITIKPMYIEIIDNDINPIITPIIRITTYQIIYLFHPILEIISINLRILKAALKFPLLNAILTTAAYAVKLIRIANIKIKIFTITLITAKIGLEINNM